MLTPRLLCAQFNVIYFENVDVFHIEVSMGNLPPFANPAFTVLLDRAKLFCYLQLIFLTLETHGLSFLHYGL